MSIRPPRMSAILEDLPYMKLPTLPAPPMFRQTKDGVIAEDPDAMPHMVAITEELLDGRDKRWLDLNGDTVTVSVLNGLWRYRLLGRNHERGEVYAEMIEKEGA